MAYTLDDFQRESWERILKEIPAEKLLEGIPLEKRLEGIPVEKQLQGIPVEEIEAYLKKLKSE